MTESLDHLRNPTRARLDEQKVIIAGSPASIGSLASAPIEGYGRKALASAAALP